MVWHVKGWHKFQHFKDRKPPWVKLYRDLLDDMDWHELDPVAAKALVSLWLIASENNGQLPDNKILAFRLRVTEKAMESIVSKLDHWLEQVDINAISERYQDDPLETEGETEKETETETTLSGNPDVSPPKVFHKETAIRVIDFLNAKTGKNFQHASANVDLIVARLKDGATEQDCKSVIARKVRDWKDDDKMREYLRPATLFNREKFAQYQGQLVAPESNPWDGAK